MTPQVIYDEFRPQAEIVVEGYAKGDQDITQVLTAYESKSAAIFKIQYATTKYLQYSLTHVSHHSGLNNKGDKSTLTLKTSPASAFSYYWTGDEPTDPSNYINHADP